MKQSNILSVYNRQFLLLIQVEFLVGKFIFDILLRLKKKNLIKFLYKAVSIEGS